MMVQIPQQMIVNLQWMSLAAIGRCVDSHLPLNLNRLENGASAVVGPSSRLIVHTLPIVYSFSISFLSYPSEQAIADSGRVAHTFPFQLTLSAAVLSSSNISLSRR